jgi:transcription antitermination factor NusG
MQKDTIYFSHDANASEDIKLMAAEDNFGPLAYCWFFKTIELLRQQRYLQLELKDIRVIYKKVKCPSEQMYLAFIQTSELFGYNEQYFWSDSLIGRVGNVLLISQTRSDASKKKWYNFYLAKGDNEKAMSYINGISNKKLLPNNLPPVINKKQNNIIDITENQNPESDPEPLFRSSEIPSNLPFKITPLAEDSWKMCLLTCSKSFQEISEIYNNNIPEDVFKSYKSFNHTIDTFDEKNGVDLRQIRIASIQVDLQSYHYLYKTYPDRSIIKQAMINYVRIGVAANNSVYNKIGQYIGYIKEDTKNGTPVSAGTNGAKRELIRGYYYVNNQKQLSIDVNDMEQCRQLIKIAHNQDLSDEEIKKVLKEKGEKKFKVWLEV